MRVTHGCINTGNYFDDPGFVPYMGAVLINPGGDVQFRSETTEGQEVAQKLSILGYVTFVVHYRVRPYTMQEGALDLARAVRYVRSHADDYQIDEEDIAIIGFSAGGILCGEEVLHYDGFVNGTSLDASYVSDELDEVSVDVHVLENMPHGFGIGREDSQWIIPFDEWLSKIFEN